MRLATRQARRAEDENGFQPEDGARSGPRTTISTGSTKALAAALAADWF